MKYFFEIFRGLVWEFVSRLFCMIGCVILKKNMGKFRHLQDVRQKFRKNAKSTVLVTGKVKVIAV